MKSDELGALEAKVRILEDKHDHLEHDIVLLKEIFKHIKDKLDDVDRVMKSRSVQQVK